MALLLSITAPGCLVAEPSDYEEPRRTPPFLDLYAAKPFVGEVIAIDRTDADMNDRIDFKIPVRSDDQGENLFWVLYLDRTFTGELAVEDAEVPASTIDDTTRYVQYPWPADNRYSKGCHTLSFVVAHKSSWSNDAQPTLLDPNDAAVGTWWINIDPGPADSNTLTRCPSRTENRQ